ncbi:unnamed protein product [Orchesella dallaii]|uniref:FAD-binding FR-type domain-containing protein n=1 Tax=Orchesella dallaii TaxID=48710 RepID=A0ABP1QE00_9HEXA
MANRWKAVSLEELAKHNDVEFQHASHESDWTVGILDQKLLQVFKRIDIGQAWYSSYELPEPLCNDNVSVQFKNNFEHLDISIRKPVPNVSRPYTPALPAIMDQENEEKHRLDPHILYFIIKIYPMGALSRALDQLEIDDGKEVPTLQVSTPLGIFDPEFLNDFTLLLLIAGGTGMYSCSILIIGNISTYFNTVYENYQ